MKNNKARARASDNPNGDRNRARRRRIAALKKRIAALGNGCWLTARVTERDDLAQAAILLCQVSMYLKTTSSFAVAGAFNDAQNVVSLRLRYHRAPSTPFQSYFADNVIDFAAARARLRAGA